jgi:PhnB protein
MGTKSIPDGYDALIPSVIVRDAAEAIDFYKQVFGATEIMRMPYPDGKKIAHAELKIRNHVLMLGDECPEMGALAPDPAAVSQPRSVMVYVEDVERVFNKALEKGAKSVMPPKEMFWGDRYGKFLDPFGHLWGVATHTRDVSPEEMARAAAQWGKPKPAS